MRFALAATLVLVPSTLQALEPSQVWLIVNKNEPDSRRVADYYITKRGVPKTNVSVLDLPKSEAMSRADYDSKLAAPLRHALRDHKDRVRVLLATYGVPLRVGQQLPNAEEKKEIEKLRPAIDSARKRLAELQKRKEADKKEVLAARNELEALRRKEAQLSHGETQASVDSELMLLWWSKYELVRWVPNPLHFQASEAYRQRNPPVMMTCRLDGPTAAIAQRLVDDALAAEASGLKGEVVIDSRGIAFNPKGQDIGTGYAGYDESFRETAKLLESAGMKVTHDSKNEVLPPGSAKGVAIYCGWYSHGKFVDCCEYVTGAVAWHLASSEATTLRRPDTKVWCPNLLRKGVCATLGPVAEPYTIGFPKPAEFFGFLATGEFTLVETYARTVQMCSWMTVLIGDPLYNPFRKNPRLKPADVAPSPKGGRNILP